MKADISSMYIEEISEFLQNISNEHNIKIQSFRAKQIFDWLISGVHTFDEMSNLPKDLREVLKNTSYISLPHIEKKLVSNIDGTVKYLFKLWDGECIESVVMKYEHGNTICISTQAGCRMGCTFCASTVNGLSRNLTPSEMLGQIVAAQNDLSIRISNIVMMGIGEPLDNYDNVIKFLRLVNCKDGLNIGHRHISLSTSGIVPNILKLAEEEMQITLSVSLHNPFQEERKKLMPVSAKYPLDDLIQACKIYQQRCSRRISFEYTMIDGKTDTPKHAECLSQLLRGIMSHVNLIPLNNVEERDLKSSSPYNIKKFISILEKNNITCTVRRKLGSDINASCGQLRKKSAEQ